MKTCIRLLCKHGVMTLDSSRDFEVGPWNHGKAAYNSYDTTGKSSWYQKS